MATEALEETEKAAASRVHARTRPEIQGATWREQQPSGCWIPGKIGKVALATGLSRSISVAQPSSQPDAFGPRKNVLKNEMCAPSARTSVNSKLPYRFFLNLYSTPTDNAKFQYPYVSRFP